MINAWQWEKSKAIAFPACIKKPVEFSRPWSVRNHNFKSAAYELVCYTSVFSVVMQRGALRDDTKNGCVADYSWTRLISHAFKKNWTWACDHISLYVGAKRLVFHLSPRDGHVIIVSGCLILTAVNLIVLIQMAYKTERLVKLCKIYCDIWHRLT